jgi:hypothetical protein
MYDEPESTEVYNNNQTLVEELSKFFEDVAYINEKFNYSIFCNYSRRY